MKIIGGRKALVTAADYPAGRSIALALASEGADVYLFGRSPQELAVTLRAASASGVEVVSATCDLTEPAQLGAAVKSVLERWGGLHILVNNPEEMHCGPAHAMTIEHWHRVLCANLIAPIELVRALLPTLARQDEAHILNVCSLLGLVPARGVAALQTSQFGLVGFTAALRAEYIRKGFGMTALCPGLVRSSFADEVFSGEAVAVACDLSQPAQIHAAVGTLLDRWSGLDILINNAGVIYYGPTHGMTAEEWQRLLSINLLAPIQLIRELLPALLAQKEAHILNVCSMLGLAGGRKVAAYQTSKFALVGLSAALRAEYAGTGLGVTALCPGFVRTSAGAAISAIRKNRGVQVVTPAAHAYWRFARLFPGHASRQRVQIPTWSQGTPEGVAGAAISAIRKNRGVQVVTPAAHAYWRFARLFPGLVDWVNREGWRQRGMIKSI